MDFTNFNFLNANELENAINSTSENTDATTIPDTNGYKEPNFNELLVNLSRQLLDAASDEEQPTSTQLSQQQHYPNLVPSISFNTTGPTNLQPVTRSPVTSSTTTTNNIVRSPAILSVIPAIISKANITTSTARTVSSTLKISFAADRNTLKISEKNIDLIKPNISTGILKRRNDDCTIVRIIKKPHSKAFCCSQFEYMSGFSKSDYETFKANKNLYLKRFSLNSFYKKSVTYTTMYFYTVKAVVYIMGILAHFGI